MFLSRVQLNPQRRKTREALANPQILHAMVASSLPPNLATSEEGRLLWRVDRDGHDVRLYMVSPHRPGLEHIIEQAGWEAAPGQTTDYSRFLNRIARGQEYSFRITANPVKQERVAGARGKLLPIFGAEDQIRWFGKRASQWGFQIPEIAPLPDTIGASKSDVGDVPAVRILRAEDRVFSKKAGEAQRRVTQRHVTLVGELSVTDPDLLRHGLTHGMGRGKAYGCGLMTLAGLR